jgi:hypothetical protein
MIRKIAIFILFALTGINAYPTGDEQKWVTQNPFDLYKEVARSEDDPTDAAFLYIIADLRTKIDAELYPLESAEDDPGILLGAIRFSVGSSVESSIPVLLRNSDWLITRLEAWKPDFSDSYKTLWQSSSPYSKKQRVSVADRIIRAKIHEFRRFRGLIQHDDYWEAFLIRHNPSLPEIPADASVAEMLLIYEEDQKRQRT